MIQEITALVKAMGSGEWDEELLERLSQVAQQQLESWLRPGVTVEDCGGAFPIAAAWMVLGALYRSRDSGQVDSFSAGDLTIKTGAGGHGRELEEQARRLMAPYCRETGFAFRGVKG